jgi:hypothetical protein
VGATARTDKRRAVLRHTLVVAGLDRGHVPRASSMRPPRYSAAAQQLRGAHNSLARRDRDGCLRCGGGFVVVCDPDTASGFVNWCKLVVH